MKINLSLFLILFFIISPQFYLFGVYSFEAPNLLEILPSLIHKHMSLFFKVLKNIFLYFKIVFDFIINLLKSLIYKNLRKGNLI